MEYHQRVTIPKYRNTLHYLHTLEQPKNLSHISNNINCHPNTNGHVRMLHSRGIKNKGSNHQITI